MLEARHRRGPGSAFVPRDHDTRGARLRHTRCDRPDADFTDELDADPRLRIDAGEVVDQLREVLDRVDVVVRWRRDQRDAGCRATDLRDPLVDLGAGELAAFAGLRTLRDLDLEILGIHQVMRRHAEAT